MINIVLNHPNFDEAWGYSEMEPYIHKEDEVLVLAFYDDSGYSSDMEVFEDSFSEGQKMYEEIVRPFRMFGLKDAQIHVVNYFDASKQEVLHQIEKADIIYIVGRFADWIMQRLEDLDGKNLTYKKEKDFTDWRDSTCLWTMRRILNIFPEFWILLK